MRVIIFGASGMVGAGALREALASPHIQEVLCVGRSPLSLTHPKLSELILEDLFELERPDVAERLEAQLTGCDACLWSIGVTSMGCDEATYARYTEELTLLWARVLLHLNPELSWCYCSAGGADSNVMWARVRKRLELALCAMPFKRVGVVRPLVIRPGQGIKSKTKAYQVGITLMTPLFWLTPLLLRLIPTLLTTSEHLGRAMLRVVMGQTEGQILESRDINRLGSPKF